MTSRSCPVVQGTTALDPDEPCLLEEAARLQAQYQRFRKRYYRAFCKAFGLPLSPDIEAPEPGILDVVDDEAG